MGDEALEKLLENRDSEDKDGKGNTLLHFAVKRGQMSVIKALLQNGADINAQNAKGKAPLHWATNYAIKSCDSSSRLNTIRTLLRLRKPKINTVNNEESAPIRYSKVAIVKFLLEKGADSLLVDKKRRLPRYFAYNDRIEQLLQNAEICQAARIGCVSYIKGLLEEGVDVNVKDKHGNTPLHYAAECRQIEVVKYLIEQGADVKIKSKYRSTPLHCAAEWGQIEVVKYLVAKGADVNVQNRLEETPLHLAVQKDHIKIVEYLLAQGAGINTESREGMIPLHYAVEKGHTEIVRYLLEKGADIDAQNGYGETPLHLAAEHKNIEVVKILLALGADVNVVAKNGKTALQMATKSRLFSKSIYGQGFLGKVQANTSDIFEEHSSASTAELPSKIEFRKRSDQEVIDALLAVGAKPDTQMDETKKAQHNQGVGWGAE
ncbi:MAG TPA: hypothetical protein DEQ74_00555 [Wolbachia sp.]|uniref:ankyrin repeat domain-containing protein n=1 Tax=Wolbachia endosymbiont of Pentalonia nigronervosa TaxID=1301914 RepID=UPI000EDA9F1F|nr:ankyrin repeat domain-containing protein [Wolbachia endosymbiont of Pentalonia nigronervosa]MBD0391836.1 ankyrin repeat domain-containing protein [Wolbachia endosymbiont of Pentalonia nigronervosa]HCE59317.1 hypothetical protein [Wolbachia sp.]